MHTTSCEKTMTYSFHIDEMVLSFSAKFQVCSRCSGTGKHVNPSVDGNGISQEEFDEDPDFREAYFAGAYDVVCECCKGKRVVLSVDEDSFSEQQKENWKIVQNEISEEHKFQRICEMERRMGA